MKRLFFAVADLLARAADTVARLLLAFVFGVLFLEVVLRFCFNTSIDWSLEACRYAMIWAVMLSGSLMIRDNELISVDFLDEFWPAGLRIWRDIVYRILLLVVLVVLMVTGFSQASDGLRQTTPVLQISWFWPYLALPVGAALMIVQMAYRAMLDFVALRDRQARGR